MAEQSTSTIIATTNVDTIPLRPFKSKRNDFLPSSVSIIGLGCSSYSSFFWTEEESKNINIDLVDSWSVDTIQRTHPIVQNWIDTIIYAITKAGITLLDTAPWYGHGTSEVVIGWALDDLFSSISNNNNNNNESSSLIINNRNQIIINTKVGRYEADLTKQFDFTRNMTLLSVQRSIKRMNCTYIDVLQLHDPEFSPSLNLLMTETIPAMLECQQNGLCKALGMTGKEKFTIISNLLYMRL